MTEIKTLAQAEKVISESESSFIAVGEALAVIRDKALFEKASDSKAPSFESYCATRWEWSRVHAYRFINGAVTARLAEQAGYKLNERQCRELKDIKDGEILEMILDKAKELSDTGRVTAASIVAARKQLAPTEKDKADAEAEASAADHADDTKPDADVEENWPNRFKEYKRQVSRATGDLPAEYMEAWIKHLETQVKKAKRLKAGLEVAA